MAVCTEHSNSGKIAALICEKTHSLDLERQGRFVRDGVGRVSQRSPNVVRHQSGICVEEIFDSGALGEFAQQELDGYPRSADHGLTLHDVCIDLDPVGHELNSGPILPAVRRFRAITRITAQNAIGGRPVALVIQQESAGLRLHIQAIPVSPAGQIRRS
jgi:hypothetical protein